jgi:hypothetical membrane protein
MAEGFRGVVGLLDRIGVYDIVLPFLFVFTIVFAILEKTRIFGMEKVGDVEVTKKNINAMVALIIAFLVVASTRLVSLINEVLANVVLLLILSICFLILVGSFHGDKPYSLENTKWASFFMVLMFIGLVIIFLNAMGWLQAIWDFLQNFEQDYVATIVFLAITIGFIIYITWDKKPSKEKEEKK